MNVNIPMFTIIINGNRQFVFCFTTCKDTAYAWCEGYCYGANFTFDDYNPKTDSDILRVNIP